jgi:hypothetical protein
MSPPGGTHHLVTFFFLKQNLPLVSHKPFFPKPKQNRAPPCSSPGKNRHRPFSFTNSRPAAGFRAGGGGAVSSREFFILLFRD